VGVKAGGSVTARKTDIGALISAGNAGQELFEVSDLHKARIYVQVPQAFSGELHPGLKAKFEMPQYPAEQFDATVVTMSDAMDVNSRSMRVEPPGRHFRRQAVRGRLLPSAFRAPE
jgi:Barrel-sandwich domain of CusB or HlyD membrane-fusion